MPKHPLQTQLDHLVFAAPNLIEGVQYLEDQLGIQLQPGGEHPRMGTHNALLKVGTHAYLEVIAINPAADNPGRPRWFDLDNRPIDAPTSLCTWVARSNDIHSAATHAPHWFGAIVPMQRGALNWLISIPADGRLALGGLCPSLIEWPHGLHPSSSLEDRGCTLLGLELYHPQAAILQELLWEIGFEGEISISEAERVEMKLQLKGTRSWEVSMNLG
jgi:Glyoxalase-like domain